MRTTWKLAGPIGHAAPPTIGGTGSIAWYQFGHSVTYTLLCNMTVSGDIQPYSHIGCDSGLYSLNTERASPTGVMIAMNSQSIKPPPGHPSEPKSSIIN